MTTSQELSYARPDDPLLKRFLMRAVENLFGRRRLLPIYDRWRREIAGRSPTMWNDLLDLIGTRLDVHAPDGWHKEVPAGPLVIIANHPFGIADGIAILALAERIGRPYRILINRDFMRMPEIQPLGLPIDFSGTREARAINVETRAQARSLLKQGITVVVCPAGGVATAESVLGRAEELPWNPFVARLVKQAGATVLPVYFAGQNSPLFHLVSRYSLTLRLSLLVCELRYKIGATIEASVGSPAASSDISTADRGGTFIDELYLLVHRLAPGAKDRDHAALLPRPVGERRCYPWDKPQIGRPPLASQRIASGARDIATAARDVAQP